MTRLLAQLGALVLLFVILTQDFQIYPEIPLRLTGHAGPYVQPPADANAVDYFLPTADGERIHVRRWAPTGPAALPIRTAILSHGNASTMDDWSTVPRWLASRGVATYIYDYRGYGLSSGWPSERGLYNDADAVWREAQIKDGANPQSTLAFGHSLGGGPASYLAEKHNLAVLVTAATFTSLPDRIARHPLFGRLSPFVWAQYPNRERVARLRDTCLIVLHARHDDGMPLSMAQELVHAYSGTRRALFAEAADAGHADILRHVPALAEPLLKSCTL